LSVLSLLVGAYYAIKDRQGNDKENYYFGKRSMSPVSLKADMLQVAFQCSMFLNLAVQTIFPQNFAIIIIKKCFFV